MRSLAKVRPYLKYALLFTTVLSFVIFMQDMNSRAEQVADEVTDSGASS
jgi:predicted exporter